MNIKAFGSSLVIYFDYFAEFSNFIILKGGPKTIENLKL
jgi:hypothetical protein